jgi:hypothetical protein
MCRIHGPGCSTPWGYDRDHTDSDRPYTLDELAIRQSVPHFYAYPTSEDYLEGGICGGRSEETTGSPPLRRT